MGRATILTAPRKQGVGIVGDEAESDIYGQHKERPFPVGSDKTKQVFEVLLDEDSAPSAGDIIALRLYDEYVLEYEAVGTLATDLSNLKDAIDEDPIFAGAFTSVTIADSDSDTTNDSLLLEGDVAGYDYGLLAAVSNCTVTETTEESFGSAIPFGRAVYLDANGFLTLTYPGSAGDGVNSENLLGVSKFLYARQSRVLGESPTEGNPRRLQPVWQTAAIVVEGGANASSGDQIWVQTSTGAGLPALGTFHTSDDGTNREAMDLAIGRWIRPHVIEITLR